MYEPEQPYRLRQPQVRPPLVVIAEGGVAGEVVRAYFFEGGQGCIVRLPRKAVVGELFEIDNDDGQPNEF